MKILIADDDTPSRLILRNLFTQWGYEVTAAADGDQAWQVLQQTEAPQLAILDWEMPGLAGPEICRKLRERQDAPYTYIILLTARNKHDDLIAGLEAGADDYVAKPFDHQELRVRLRAGRRILDLQSTLLEVEQALRLQATQDPLTGLWNHGMIMQLLERELVRARRERAPVSVLMADLDLFKRVNDTYGHLAGDRVLREAAQRIRAIVRPYDGVGRYGGEEFLVVLPGCAPPASYNLAERVHQAIGATPMDTSEGLIAVTVSIGLAWVDYASIPGEDVQPRAAAYSEAEALVHAADVALYRAKRNGRNCIEGDEVQGLGPKE